MTVALAHDILGARAGGERVLSALMHAFPDAPIHTLLYEPSASFAEFNDRKIETSWLNRSAWLRRNYRVTVPLAALTYAATQIDADVTICSTSGLSHHVRVTGAKLVYCHTPARWLHDTDTYLAGFPTPARLAATAIAPLFRRLDRAAMGTADLVVANSTHVANEIKSVYGIEATVVAPCSTLDIDGHVEAVEGCEPGFVLSPVRALGYKRLDLLVEAARALPEMQFVHIGEGPYRQALFADSPPNIVSLGDVSDAQLRWTYRNARMVALTCAEDFGLVPLEAAAHGLHTAAPNARGIRDHDQSMLTSYPHASIDGLVKAIENAPAPTGNVDESRLGRDEFTEAIAALVRTL